MQDLGGGKTNPGSERVYMNNNTSITVRPLNICIHLPRYIPGVEPTLTNKDYATFQLYPGVYRAEHWIDRWTVVEGVAQ